MWWNAFVVYWLKDDWLRKFASMFQGQLAWEGYETKMAQNCSIKKQFDVIYVFAINKNEDYLKNIAYV